MDKKVVTTIGEAIVDWVCLDKTLDLYEATQFIKAPGGAPANVAVGLAKLHYPVRFVGGFSTDLFGRWLREFLTSFNVDISYSVVLPGSNTRNAYILTDKNDKRVLKGFSMSYCADSMLKIADINISEIAKSAIVYFGSLLQASEESKFALNDIIASVKSDSLLFYDPNFRLCLWESREDALNTVRETFKLVDIVKLSDYELELISGITDTEQAAKQIFDDYNLKLLVITLGNRGSYFINSLGSAFVRTFKVESVEETGAGDGFVAGLLGSLLDMIDFNLPREDRINHLMSCLTVENLEKILLRANAIGALTTTKPGATSALPTKDELEMFLNSH